MREQSNAEFVAMDTMNFWISSTKDDLIETVKVVDCVIINDAEARQLADEPNVITAAKKILEMGPKAVVIKRGEYGAALFTNNTYFAIPAYPLEARFRSDRRGRYVRGRFYGLSGESGND